MITHTAGAVLAGGASSRMGTDKATLTYLGVPFIDHVLATMSLVLVDIAVCGRNHGATVTHLKDPFEGVGPLAGLLAALEWADGRPVFVAPVDMPLLTAELITRLVEPPLRGSAARIAVRSDDGSVQPLCGVYAPGAAKIIRRRLESDNRSVLGFLADLDTVHHVVADASTLTNVNTPADLAALPDAYPG